LTAAKPAAAAGASTTTSAPAQQPPPTLQPGESPWIGFAVKKAPGKDTIFVKDVVEAGPADRAGILDGDEMVSFGGDRVTNMEEFRAAVRKHAIVGHTVEVKYMRDKDGVDNAVSGTAQIAVGTRKKEVVKDVPTISTVEDVKAVLRDQTKLDAFSAGAFAEADADMSGLVSPAEFTSAMRRWIPTALVSWMSEDNFTDLFDGADMDHSGFVSKNEFPTLVESLLGMIVAHFKSKEKEVTVPPLALGAITGGSSSSSSSSSDLSGPRPTLGVEIKMLDDGQGGKENMVVVHSVVPEGPADKAGIMVNDGLLSWDGVALDSKEKFREAIKKAEIDSWISLDILRNGEQMTIPLQVEGTTEMKSPPRIVELVAP
jgi:predicted metalloprotease with PDZ domain